MQPGVINIQIYPTPQDPARKGYTYLTDGLADGGNILTDEFGNLLVVFPELDIENP